MKINWFPGHMTKALRMMESEIKNIDAVIYVLDARAPYSCFNPSFEKIVGNKPILYVLNKADLCEKKDIDLWLRYFSKNNNKAIALNSVKSGNKKEILDSIKHLCKDKVLKYETKGILTRIRVMVLGVPNSGKSTLINNIIGSAKTITGNKPGVTRGKQWIVVDKMFEILDTPGTLWPDIENQDCAINLALIGSIKNDVLDVNELALELIKVLKSNYKTELNSRYKLQDEENLPVEILEQIAVNRKFLLKGNEIDFERTSLALIDDFRKGRIGKIILELPNV